MSNTKAEGEERGHSNITVKSIDVYGIHERLRKDKTKEGKEVWNYIKKLNEALKKQQELTALAISKLRVASVDEGKKPVKTKEDWIDDSLSVTQLKIERLEVNCFDDDSRMSVRVGRGYYQALTVDEAKEVANFFLSHIKNETESSQEYASQVDEGKGDEKEEREALIRQITIRDKEIERLKGLIEKLWFEANDHGDFVVSRRLAKDWSKFKLSENL